MTALLAVLAHPDDESFGMGGTLALYARRGVDVYLICATGGEAGTIDPEHLQGYASAAELRSAELRCAAETLGLKEVFMLGYRDSGMPGSEDNQDPDAQINHSLDEVAARIVKRIRGLKPEVVITFDPIGGYRHPDHIHIHQATVLAFDGAGDASFHPELGEPFRPSALYFHVFRRGFMKVIVNLMPLIGQNPRKAGRNKDIDLKSLADVDFPSHVRVNISATKDIKLAASACHVSQGGLQVQRGLFGLAARLTGDHEDFMRAYPPIDGRSRRKTDLFDV